MKPIISIIIPNFNGQKQLSLSLPYLKTQTFKSFEVILCDNDSADMSIKIFLSFFPKSSVVKLTQNSGFARACNAGINKASGNYILILNNDVILKENFLEKCINIIQNSQIDMIIPLVLYFNSNLIDSFGILLGENGLVYNYLNLKTCSNIRAHNKLLGPSGAVMFFTRKLIDLTGKFEPLYFCYYEDADYILRARLLGLKAGYLFQPLCFHMGSMTAKKFPLSSLYLKQRNKWIFIFKLWPIELIKGYFKQILMYDILSFMFAMFKGGFKVALKARVDAFKLMPHLRARNKSYNFCANKVKNSLSKPPVNIIKFINQKLKFTVNR